MRIALFTYSLVAGGAERMVSLLSNHWADHGNEVDVILLCGRDLTPYHQLHPGVRVHYLNLMAESQTLADGLRRGIQRARRLRALLHHIKPDVLLAFLTIPSIQAALAAVGLPVRVVACERCSPADEPLIAAWRLARWIGYRMADGFVFQTDRVMATFPHVLQRRGVVIANPVPMTERLANPDARVIVAVGRLVPQKGFDLLVAAFAAIAWRYPDWRLVIWGEGPGRVALEALRDHLGLNERVSLPGLSAHALAWTSTGSVFVLSSRFEGFPNALCEAMAAGYAVVAADCRFGPREIVTSEQDGLLVPAENVAALTAELERLVSDDGLRRRLAAAAGRSIQRFAPANVIDQWSRFVQRIGQRRRDA